MSGESREAQELIDRLVKVAELIEGYNATLYLLEHERMQLQTALAQTGYKPQPDQGAPL